MKRSRQTVCCADVARFTRIFIDSWARAALHSPSQCDSVHIFFLLHSSAPLLAICCCWRSFSARHLPVFACNVFIADVQTHTRFCAVRSVCHQFWFRFFFSIPFPDRNGQYFMMHTSNICFCSLNFNFLCCKTAPV